MKPESDDAREERREHQVIAHAYREASHTLDERPDPHVRASVLAAAARAVDARPRDAAHPRALHPLAARRWPLSAAALLVVSIMTGLVVTRGQWERPDLVDASREQYAAREAPAQSDVPTRAAPASEGMLEPPAATDPITDRSTRRESQTRAIGSRHRASGVASPKLGGNVARLTPETAAPRDAGEISSDTTRRKTEAPASIAAAAPAAPGLAQHALARRADARADSLVEHEGPDAWVVRIVELRESGNDDEADRELARFKKRYPEFTIPREALRAMGTR